MDEKQNENESGHNIIPEWKRSKDAILDSYFKALNNYASCYNRYVTNGNYSPVELAEWKKGVRALFLQIREYENELAKKYKTRGKVDEQMKDIESLADFTDEIFNTETMKDIRAISRTEADPIKKYKVEAYK